MSDAGISRPHGSFFGVSFLKGAFEEAALFGVFKEVFEKLTRELLLDLIAPFFGVLRIGLGVSEMDGPGSFGNAPRASGDRESSEGRPEFRSRNFFASRNDWREELFREDLKEEISSYTIFAIFTRFSWQEKQLQRESLVFAQECFLSQKQLTSSWRASPMPALCPAIAHIIRAEGAGQSASSNFLATPAWLIQSLKIFK